MLTVIQMGNSNKLVKDSTIRNQNSCGKNVCTPLFAVRDVVESFLAPKYLRGVIIHFYHKLVFYLNPVVFQGNPWWREKQVYGIITALRNSFSIHGEITHF